MLDEQRGVAFGGRRVGSGVPVEGASGRSAFDATSTLQKILLGAADHGRDVA
jgi:hypothetical protein